MDRLERQTEDVKVFKNFSLETANKDEDNIIEILKRCFLQCERFIGYFSAEVSQLEKKLDLFENATVHQKSASLVQKALEFIFSESRDDMQLLFVFSCFFLGKAGNEVLRLLAILNNHLSSRTFFVGEKITLADISLVCNLILDCAYP